MTFKINSLINLFIFSAGIGIGISYGNYYLFHIILGIVLLSLAYVTLNNLSVKKIRLPTKIHYIFYYLFFVYFISISWSIDTTLSLKYLVFIIFGCILSLSIVFSLTSIEKFENIFKIIKYLIYFLLIISLLEIFTEFSWPTSPTSKFATILNKDTKILPSYMPTGLFGNPNDLAIVLIMTLPFFLLQNNMIYKLITSVIIFVIILYTDSRTNLLGYFITIILYLFFTNLKTKTLGCLILFCLVLAVAIHKPFLDALKDYLDPFIQFITFEQIGHQNSAGKRINYLIKAIESIKENFLFGIGGYGSFTLLKGASMHNIWAEMLVDIGVVGFGVFIFWYITTIIKIYMISIFSTDKNIKYYSKSMFICMIVYLFTSLSASSVIYLLPTWIMLGFAVTIININKSLYFNK